MPLFIRLLLYIFSRFGRLVLWEIIFILELQFAETQDNKNLIHCFFVNRFYKIFLIRLSAIPFLYKNNTRNDTFKNINILQKSNCFLNPIISAKKARHIFCIWHFSILLFFFCSQSYYHMKKRIFSCPFLENGTWNKQFPYCRSNASRACTTASFAVRKISNSSSSFSPILTRSFR